jgi:SAM-dependent methyltransferase
VGIEFNAAKFMVSARAAGVEFTRTLTLGQQWLLINPESVRSLFRKHASPIDLDTAVAKGTRGFFSLLGAQKVDSLDASAFEGASLIHDLNEPLPAALKGQYDLVYDGGTLEHVFNFPTAIRNAMEAVRIGGHLLFCTPTNNHCGHGFYQFSPELFYRILSDNNGFKIERMIACSAYQGSRWYEVADPARVGCRVEIRHDPHQVLLLVLAKRTDEAEIFRTMPQQSDYVAAWQSQRDIEMRKHPLLARFLNAWRDGWLPYALVLRFLKITQSHALIVAWQNRRYSRKHQPELFRQSCSRGTRRDG